MSRDDFQREQRIDLALFDLCEAGNRQQLIAAQDRMFAEIRLRSADQVAAMERQKGLR